jgi:hypothetical protein
MSSATTQKAPLASFSPLLCRRCGSLPDAARVNPATGRFGRKCAECGDWQEVRAPFHRWRPDQTLGGGSRPSGEPAG